MIFWESQLSASNWSGIYGACGQHVVMSSTLVEVLVSAEWLRDNTPDYQLYSFRRNWESYDCIVLIITAWVCYLQSWEGQTRSRKHRGVSLRKSHKVLLVSNPLFFFFSIFLSPKKKRGGTRKGIKCWIEKLIINSPRNLVLGGFGLKKKS